jgi:hypothetical protein
MEDEDDEEGVGSYWINYEQMVNSGNLNTIQQIDVCG